MSTDSSRITTGTLHRFSVWVGLFAGAALLWIVPVSSDGGKLVEGPLVAVSTPEGATIHAEMADTTEKRSRGLMFRKSLAKDRGMLFTFAEPQQWTFWMKNTRIPLDIIWMDPSKKIVHIERNVPGCDRTDDSCPQYQPNDAALYVLEVAAGVADVLKLQRGIRLKFQVSQPASPPRVR